MCARNKFFLKLAVFALVAISIVIAAKLLPAKDWIEQFIAWTSEKGAVGKLIFTGAYVVAMVACLWGTPFTLAAGVAFGLWWGTLIATFSATMGSAMAFLISRYLARGTVEKWVSRNEKFQAIDAAIEQRGWKFVFLTRFSPVVPFAISNYLFGITGIRFWQFVWASLLAIAPGSFVVVYLGHIGRLSLTGEFRELGAREYILMAGALVFTVAIVLYFRHVAKRALEDLALRKKLRKF